MGKGVILALILNSEQGLVSNVMLKGSLVYSHCEIVKFKILRVSRGVHTNLATLSFRR